MRRPQPDPRPARPGEAGFSLLETLIAAAVLLLILIGILPLFERSRLNLIQGNDSTKTSNAAIDVSERMLSANFNSFDTNLAAGTGTERTITDFWLLDGDVWASAVPAGDRAQFTRDTLIQQFGVADVSDDDADLFETPLDGNAAPGSVHLKRFQVDITNPRTAGGTAPVYRIVTIQTF